MSDNAPIPNIIRAAGNAALQVYRGFLDNPNWSQGTRRIYGWQIRRFFRWAEARGLTLTMIDAAVVAEYAAEIPGTKSRQQVRMIKRLVPDLFQRLFRIGVLAHNPYAMPREDAVRSVVGWAAEYPQWVQAGLVLLAPLSIGSMDPRRISRFSGVPLQRVERFAAVLIATGVWRPDGQVQVCCDGPWSQDYLRKLVAIDPAQCQPQQQGESAQVIEQAASETVTGHPPCTQDASDAPFTDKGEIGAAKHG
jgi:hypothetical protein